MCKSRMAAMARPPEAYWSPHSEFAFAFSENPLRKIPNYLRSLDSSDSSFQNVWPGVVLGWFKFQAIHISGRGAYDLNIRSNNAINLQSWIDNSFIQGSVTTIFKLGIALICTASYEQQGYACDCMVQCNIAWYSMVLHAIM